MNSVELHKYRKEVSVLAKKVNRFALLIQSLKTTCAKRLYQNRLDHLFKIRVKEKNLSLYEEIVKELNCGDKKKANSNG